MLSKSGDRFQITRTEIEWDFTREQLVARIAGLKEELERYEAYLADIDGKKVRNAARR